MNWPNSYDAERNHFIQKMTVLLSNMTERKRPSFSLAWIWWRNCGWAKGPVFLLIKLSENNSAKMGSENGTQRIVYHQEYLQHYLRFIVVLSVWALKACKLWRLVLLNEYFILYIIFNFVFFLLNETAHINVSPLYSSCSFICQQNSYLLCGWLVVYPSILSNKQQSSHKQKSYTMLVYFNFLTSTWHVVLSNIFEWTPTPTT